VGTFDFLKAMHSVGRQLIQGISFSLALFGGENECKYCKSHLHPAALVCRDLLLHRAVLPSDLDQNQWSDLAVCPARHGSGHALRSFGGHSFC